MRLLLFGKDASVKLITLFPTGNTPQHEYLKKDFQKLSIVTSESGTLPAAFPSEYVIDILDQRLRKVKERRETFLSRSLRSYDRRMSGRENVCLGSFRAKAHRMSPQQIFTLLKRGAGAPRGIRHRDKIFSLFSGH